MAKGKWLPYEFGDYHWHKCSVCGKADKYIETVKRHNYMPSDMESIRNYCPNCGAKMVENENDSDGFETCTADVSVYADRTQVGDIVFITTSNFEKYIPIEWIAEWRWQNSDVCCDKRVSDLFGKMIEDWRKEKER